MRNSNLERNPLTASPNDKSKALSRHCGQGKGFLRRRAAILLLPALLAGACFAETGGAISADVAADRASVALLTAQNAQDVNRTLELQIQDMRSSLATLSSALGDLAQALYENDPTRIAASALAMGRVASTIDQSPGAGEQSAGDQAALSAVTGRPGEGVNVVMARANWSTGYMQAGIFRSLLEELGYTVNELDESTTLPPTEFYPLLAQGEYDFWANGWFPTHEQYLYSELLLDDMPGERVPGDFVSIVGQEMKSGGLQGFLVDIKTADEFGIRSMADIAANPAPWDSDGDGIAEIAGCDDGWGCRTVIEEILDINNWRDVLVQASSDYDALWDEQIARLERGEPVLAFTWTPSGYITELIPGRDSYWLTVPRAPLNQQGSAALPREQCPTQPCDMGFSPADIVVVANNDFLAANPAAAKLFELVTFDVIDIALQNVRYDEGENTEEDVRNHAAEWIADNRSVVDDWLARARAAA